MTLLKNLFGKKDKECCEIKIEEVTEEKDDCCGGNEKEDCCEEQQKK
ncbi:hypothetical protein LS684_02010 [Cytobacillus spongiae]|jgi:hypothetical protein|nr:hypothetical protein [Cytobacillus spongiae]UII56287.1 hypothetical protein LS684_02010 [Cytobacillus spongiae]